MQVLKECYQQCEANISLCEQFHKLIHISEKNFKTDVSDCSPSSE